jgi:phage tail-like protein
MLVEARAAEFTRRFLSLFEASLQDMDEAIAFAPLLLDPKALPDHVLPALTARIGIRADPSWPPDRLRRLLATWPMISPLVGTPRGLRRLVAAVHGVDVIVEEHGRRRPWGAAGHARLGQVRLFGLSRASLRLGVGRLGEALIEPDADLLGPAYGSGAYRCTVHVPAALPTKDRSALESLVRAFLPADVSFAVRYTFPAVRMGPPLAVGLGTRLGGLQPCALVDTGERAVVLGRQGVLGGGRGGVLVTVGRRSVVGITT